QDAAEASVRGRRLRGGGRQRAIVGPALREVLEVRRAPSPCVSLLRAREGLTTGGDDTTRDAFAQRRLDAREGVGNATHARRNGLPVVVGLVAHEVEALTDLL